VIHLSLSLDRVLHCHARNDKQYGRIRGWISAVQLSLVRNLRRGIKPL